MSHKTRKETCEKQFLIQTLKQLRSGIWRAATESVELIAKCELITEPKVSNFYVQVCIKEQIFCLHKHNECHHLAITNYTL